MSDFSIKRVEVIPAYSRATVMSVRKSNRLMLLMLAVITLSGCNLFYKPLGGDVAPVSFSSKEEMTLFADKALHDAHGLNFAHDVQLDLTNGSLSISLVADGYNYEKKIAYECPDFDSDDSQTLSSDEVSNISNFQFGDTYVIVFPSRYEYQVKDELDKFVVFYSNQIK